MLHTPPLPFFIASLAIAIALIANVGMSLLWAIFAATLAITTIVAVARTIPRKER
jgi:hypothetical protein